MDELGELQLWPGGLMRQLPMPTPYYTFRDFPALARFARAQDAAFLSKLKSW